MGLSLAKERQREKNNLAYRALYILVLSKDDLAALGLTEASYEDNYVEIWQDNLDVFWLFKAMSTQWRTSMVGVTGLDYNCLSWVMKVNNIAGNKRILTIYKSWKG